MNASPTRRLAGALAASAAIAALAAATALADPPNYQRHLPQVSPGRTHVLEIVSGLASSPRGRPTSQPEVVAGIASPGHDVSAGVAETSQRGFDWGDAGVGSGAALAAAALTTASALALRRRVSLAH